MRTSEPSGNKIETDIQFVFLNQKIWCTTMNANTTNEDVYDQYMTLVKQGVFQSYACNYVQSKIYYNRAIELLPLHFRAHFHKANDLVNAQHVDTAQKYFAWIIENCGASMNECFRNIITAMTFSDVNKKIEFIQKAIDAEPNNYFANLSMGYMVSNQKQYEKSIEYYNVAFQNFAFSTCMVLNNIGWNYTCLEKHEQAIEYYNKSLEAYPHCVRALNNLGFTYCDHLKQYDKAEQVYKTILSIDPSNTISYVNMGTVYSLQERKEEAKQAFSKAQALDPYLMELHITLANEYSAKLRNSFYVKHDKEESRQLAAKCLETLDHAIAICREESDLHYGQDVKKHFVQILTKLSLFPNNVIPHDASNLVWKEVWSKQRFKLGMFNVLSLVNHLSQAYDYYDGYIGGIQKTRGFCDIIVILR